MLQAPFLKAGDKIAITCPAKSLIKPMDDAIKLLSSWGLDVILGDTIHAQFHQFAGTDELRAQDFQRFIDDQDIKAIIAARGGYGSVRIIDQIDFSPLLSHPKWIVGFSDITVFHMQLQKLGIQSIHGQMPATIPDSTALGLESLRKALFGEALQYEFPSHPLHIPGTCTGDLIGGNLSILISLLGSASDIDYRDKILFIEDVGEYLYAIDRMIRALDRAGKLSQLKGLLVGGFTDLKDNDIPFGFSVEEIIHAVVKKYDYPVAFNFPAGHIKDNCALRLGEEVRVEIGELCKLSF
ncbi:putative murein peptide carboxypeptidase [Pedobacter glucosidilyticus]|nr:LD-carboxypeptidase [Pedobacter glucosidilyticus]KHJ37022.1 putative murein peptide carboxypeptidase [Pedobacter glucosidilyticus]